MDVEAEYVQELGETKTNQEIAKRDLAETSNAMMHAIRNSTRAKLTLAASINRLEGMNLREPYETLIPNVIH